MKTFPALLRASVASTLALLSVASQAEMTPGLRPVLGAGLTFGGDKLATIDYDNGDSEDIKAGQLVYLYGGLRYQAMPQFSVQATIGYHVDDSRAAENGSAKFERVPFELLVHTQLPETPWRLGGGLRYTTNVRFKTSGVLADPLLPDPSFENGVGAVVEAEWLAASQFGVKVRYVHEKFDAKEPYTGSLDGSHVGVMLTWYP